MPVMDGFDAATEILKYQREIQAFDPKRKFVPIVAVTAFEDTETIKKCINIGMSAVLQKPIDLEKLDKIVKSLYFDEPETFS